ncbi:MAG: dihydroneopterin aldolase [Bacteroidia bacterium]|nr:dihydroneopterin aldolase [Bacteroidia bacterium]
MISVFLENQHVKAPVGWYAEERTARVDLYITVRAALKPQQIHDELSRTLDYASLVKIVITESAKERKLLETLAEGIAQTLQLEYPGIMSNIEIVIRKKNLPVHGFNADAAGIVFTEEY